MGSAPFDPDQILTNDWQAAAKTTPPPDISVVIPTFRRPALLAEALASVFRQAGAKIEVFVIDDCPHASARRVVESCGDLRVTYLQNPAPTGGRPAVVRNLALPLLRGRYVHFLDDDDLVPEDHYKAVLAAFAAKPGAGLVFGRIEPFGTCPPEQLHHERTFFVAAAHNAKRCSRFGSRFSFAGWMLFGPALLVCSAGIVQRAAIERVGGFDPQMRLIEDTEFFCRIARADGACFIDRVSLRYRIGSPSLMHAPEPTPGQKQAERDGLRYVWTSYRRRQGTLEFLALAAFTRLFLKYV